MTPIESIAGLALGVAGHVADLPFVAVSPGLMWATVAVWGLVAGLLATLTGIVASARKTPAAECTHTVPVRPTLGTLCPACAH